MRVVEAVFAGIGIAAVAGGAAFGIAKLIQKLKTAREFDQARLNDLHMKVYELQNSNIDHKEIFERLRLLETDVNRLENWCDSVVANEAQMVKHREITGEQKLKEADDA